MVAEMVAIPVWCERGERHEVHAPTWPTVSEFEGLIYEQHKPRLPEGVTPAEIKVFGPDGETYTGRQELPRVPVSYHIVKACLHDQYEAFKGMNVIPEFKHLKQDIRNVLETQSLVDNGYTAEGRESLNALVSVGIGLMGEEEEHEAEEEAAGVATEDKEEKHVDEDGGEADEEEAGVANKDKEEKHVGENGGEEAAARRIFVRHWNSHEVHELRVPLDARVVDIEAQVFQEILREPKDVEAGQIILSTDGRTVEFPHSFTPPVGDVFAYHVLGVDPFQFLDQLEDMHVSPELEVLQDFMRTLALELSDITGCTAAWRELVLTMQTFLKAAERRISLEGETMSAGKKTTKMLRELGSRLITTLDNIVKGVSRKKERLAPEKATKMLREDYRDVYGACRWEKKIDKELWRAFLGTVTSASRT